MNERQGLKIDKKNTLVLGDNSTTLRHGQIFEKVLFAPHARGLNLQSTLSLGMADKATGRSTHAYQAFNWGALT